jgi:hypothetical protein
LGLDKAHILSLISQTPWHEAEITIDVGIVLYSKTL